MAVKKGVVFCVFLIVVLGLSCQIPLVRCRSPFESIIAGFDKDYMKIQGNLTYPTDDWYFDTAKTVTFSLTLEISEEISVDINVTRLLFFLDFQDEDPEYSFVTLLNQTDLVQSSFSHSTVIHNDTYSLAVNEKDVDFIPEYSEWVVFGFLVTLDVGIHNNGTYNQLNHVNIYSSKPESANWTYSPGMYTTNSKDSFWLYKHTSISDFSSYLPSLALFGAVLILCVSASLYQGSDFRERRRKSNLNNYIQKKAEIYGRSYNFGGVRVTLAYYMILAFPKLADEYRSVVIEWALKKASLDITTIVASDVTYELQPTWYKLREQLSINARQVDVYLYQQFPRGNRATEMIRLLRKSKLSLTREAIPIIESQIDNEVEEEYHRVSPSGVLFTNLRVFVEEHLELIVPDELSQLRGALEQLEERPEPDVYASVTLSCRDLHEALLFNLVTEQVLASGASKPPENRTHYNADNIVRWLREQLGNSAEEPIALVEKGFSFFLEYNKQLDKIIQRDVHKDKVDLKEQEVTAHVIALFSLYSELFLLLERAEFDWALVGKNRE